MNDSAALPVACLAVALGLTACSRDPMDDPEYAATCHGPPLASVAAREEARRAGYSINAEFDCIDRESWEEVERAHALVASLVEQAEAEVAEDDADAPASEQSMARLRQAGSALAEARREFRTTLGAPASGMALPSPPPELFVRSDYESPGLGKLPAWVTPDPRDGQEHPAIVWITGGDSNSLDDFWTEGGADNDQSASAFRKAGMIMMFPTLRGGNTNPGRKEFFLGEVDDIIAAANHVASLPYVGDVYLGGHSTGGTLALLVSESSHRFEAVFVFGAVSDAAVYGSNLLPFDLEAADARERRLRAPIRWLEDIATPTYLIEGRDPPGNFAELEALCAATRNPAVKCVPVNGRNHFSVLDVVSKKLAARIVVGVVGDKPLVKAAEFTGAD